MGGVQAGVGAEGLGGGANGFLVGGGEGAQGVLDAVAELGEDGLRQVERVLGDEIDAHALGADQADDLFDFFHQGFGGVTEQQVGLVKEEDQLGLFQVADFGQFLEQFGQQPEQESGVEPGRVDQLVGRQDVDRAMTIRGEQHQVGQSEGGFAEEFLAVLLVEHQEFSLDGADGSLGDVAVFGAEFGGPFADMGQDGTEVLEVEQQQAVGVGQGEGDVEDAFLGFGQVKDSGQEDRTHFGDGGSDGVALGAEDVPEHGWGCLVGVVGDAEFSGSCFEFRVRFAGLGDSRQVALDVGAEDRDAGRREGFGHDLEGDGLAGAGGTSDQAVAIGGGQVQQAGGIASGDQDVGHVGVLRVFGHGALWRAWRGGRCGGTVTVQAIWGRP